MPDVTRYATQGEVGMWLNKAFETNHASIRSNGYDSVVQKSLTLHFGESTGAGQEDEGVPVDAQIKDCNAALESAILDAVNTLPPDNSKPTKISVLMAVNHKLDKRGDNFMRRNFDSAHWTGAAIDVVIQPDELKKLKELQNKEKDEEKAIKSCDDALKILKGSRQKNSLSQVLGVLKVDALENVLSVWPDLQTLAKLAQEKVRLQKYIEEQPTTSRERAVAKESLKKVDAAIERLESEKYPFELLQEKKRLQEFIKDNKFSTSLERSVAVQNLKIIESQIVGLERDLSALQKLIETKRGGLNETLSSTKQERFDLITNVKEANRFKVTHYDSWGGKERSARYKRQLDGVLEGAGLPKSKSASADIHSQRATTATCGDHTAINLARHVGCKTIFGKNMNSVDLPNNDSNIRRISDRALSALEKGTEADRDYSGMLKMERPEESIFDKIKHYVVGSVIDTGWAGIKTGINAVGNFVQAVKSKILSDAGEKESAGSTVSKPVNNEDANLGAKFSNVSASSKKLNTQQPTSDDRSQQTGLSFGNKSAPSSSPPVQQSPEPKNVVEGVNQKKPRP